MASTLEQIGWSAAGVVALGYMAKTVISEIVAWRRQPPKPPAQPTRPFVSLADDPGYQASKAKFNASIRKLGGHEIP